MRSTLLFSLGERIRDLRKLKGLSQEELGERSGFHFTYIGGLERGERNISLVNLEKVASSLSVNLYELLQAAESSELKSFSSIHEAATKEITVALKQFDDKEVVMLQNIIREIKKAYK
ncbi:helix-turn-helix domain-containing protein [Paenibacillus roseipurpureus]|uniref:Helix-turn-helix transcriptional regulator n=1 Tax=Paenibacillus roseopurpureus TaxID=2918901 RepID=A0AA96RLB4_9BACL|nr:helix-turn-helix transcriptional regulator [Paenibacillus sp. MBLB1832]WNR45229.1 helix-turn-helix transcriptional regulator [Paenibacillus sp. MBLB1832]